MLSEYKGPSNHTDMLESLVGDTVQGWYVKNGNICLVFSGGYALDVMAHPMGPLGGFVTYARKVPNDVRRDIVEDQERLRRFKSEMENAERNIQRIGGVEGAD